MAFLSQSPSQTSLLSLSLKKFSFCISAAGATRTEWTHYPSQNNLFSAFDRISVFNFRGNVIEKHVLKIVRSGDLLVRFWM